jgi:hypothetical protein
MKSGLGYLSRKRRGSVVGASTGLIILHCNELRSGKCGNLQHPGRRRAYRILQGDCLAVVLTWAIGRRGGRNQLVRTITPLLRWSTATCWLHQKQSRPEPASTVWVHQGR